MALPDQSGYGPGKRGMEMLSGLRAAASACGSKRSSVASTSEGFSNRSPSPSPVSASAWARSGSLASACPGCASAR